MGFEWVPQKNYKRHFICLNCQKGFKQASEKDRKHSKSIDISDLMNEYYASETETNILNYIYTAHQKTKVVCPNCQCMMVQVHYDFEIPAQTDNKSWKTLQKEMSTKTTIKYETYIHWHQLELKKEDKNTLKFKLLKQNLDTLEKIN